MKTAKQEILDRFALQIGPVLARLGQYDAAFAAIDATFRPPWRPPSAFMESHVHQLLGKHLLERGKTTIYGEGRNKINVVSACDVATLAVMALNNQKAENEIMEIGGPTDISKREIAETYLRLSGRAGKVTCVPTALMRLMCPLVRPFNPVLSRLLAMGIWTDTTDQTFAPAALGRFCHMGPTRLDDFIREQIISAPA